MSARRKTDPGDILEETVVVRLSAPGTGAIAVLEVVGPEARALVGRHLKLGGGHEVVHGRIADEVLARFVPRSFTGAPAVEITCHGGEEAVRAVIRTLGVREIDRETLLDRAVAGRRLDRIRAEAMTLLPRALTLRAAEMLADQAKGALTAAVKRMRHPGRLLASAGIGCALVSPRTVAIVGRTNVGKSTLFNAVVERERALVAPQPGSTRDPVEELVAIDGVPLRLVDTAGLAPAATLLDQLAMDRARTVIESADLVLLVRDRPFGPEEREFLGRIGRPSLDVRTKTDLKRASPREIGVCAPAREGLDRLRIEILRRLGLDVRPSAGAAVVFTERQRRILEEGGPSAAARLLWEPRAGSFH